MRRTFFTLAAIALFGLLALPADVTAQRGPGKGPPGGG